MCVHIRHTHMYTEQKARLNLTISQTADDELRLFYLDHRKAFTLSEFVEVMIHHCVSDRHFIEKLTKKEEAIPC